MQVCVYCASSAKIDSAYFEATEELARLLVANDVQVVFGGGGSGLMGKLADVVLQHGGKIKGIMPQFMNEVEWGHTGVNTRGYYNLFQQWMDLAVEEKFMSDDQNQIWRMVDSPADVLATIHQFERKRIDIKNAGKMR